MRLVLQSLNHGDSCVFKLENEEVWAVGWSDVHYKTYITTHGLSSEGEPAQKKRQRLDGRNYRIDITHPKVIATYHNHMGWGDRHNRLRQDILGLHVIWETKRWRTRVQIEIFAMALVDAFLIARTEMEELRRCRIFFLPVSARNPTHIQLPTPMRLWLLCGRNVPKCSLGKALYNRVQDKASPLRNKDVATTASRARRKKTRKGQDAPEELRTPAVATQRYIAAKRAWAIAGLNILRTAETSS
jgi:hypothetical protein